MTQADVHSAMVDATAAIDALRERVALLLATRYELDEVTGGDLRLRRSLIEHYAKRAKDDLAMLAATIEPNLKQKDVIHAPRKAVARGDTVVRRRAEPQG